MPATQKYIFNRKLLHKALEQVDITHIDNFQHKKTVLTNWKLAVESTTLKNAGEVAIHGDFLIDIFCQVLGYKRQIEHPAEWNLTHEQKTKTDATKADGALGFFTSTYQDIRAVIELKDIRTDLDAKQHRAHDKRTPIEQAFSYAHKSGKYCRWVIVSNYQEIRFYHADSSGEYEHFSLTELTHEDVFRRFYFLMSADNFLSKEHQSTLDALYSSNETEQENISKTFYTQYKHARIHLFEHIKQMNPNHEVLLLLEKTQKLLDRFIFVCFCEDTHLLPQKIFREVVQRAQESFAFTEQKIWTELKGLFHAIDQGYSARGINAFNGGLFSSDSILDTLIIKDGIFEELSRITDYDFDSDLSVNILGHIFEQSISDLEDLKASIQHEEIDLKQGKRKKEGIFYTPEYITRHIVEQTVGGWLEERMSELGIDQLPELNEQDYATIRHTKSGFKYNKRVKFHVNFWETYKKILMNIKVIDPACGSGAFLNQAFDFLHNEGQRVNEILANFRQGQREIFDLDKHILSHNLYGVDLNNESVEITKLSLWLKTANKHSPLTVLDDNIRCGNSLIDNPFIAGEKSFEWEKEFPAIMQDSGFDVVIGNPPYVFAREKISEEEKKYYVSNYQSAQYQVNTYVLFIEKSIQLLNDNGFYGLIVPNAWLMVYSAINLREYILKTSIVHEIVNLSGYSFEGVHVETIILTAEKGKERKARKLRVLLSKEQTFEYSHSRNQEDFLNNEGYEFKVFSDEKSREFSGKLKIDTITLNEATIIKAGLKAYESGKGNPKQTPEDVKNRPYDFNYKYDEDTYPYLEGRDVGRYYLNWSGGYLKYGGHLAAPRTFDIFDRAKIIVREITGKFPKSIMASFTSDIYLFNMSNIAILEKENSNISLKYILAVLNSNLMSYYFLKNTAKSVRRMFPKIILKDLRKFPIKIISIEEQAAFIGKTDKMLELSKRFHGDINKFLRFIESSYTPKKLSNKLKEFYSLSFADFIKEAKKQKIALSKKEEFGLMEVFEEQKAKVLEINCAIKTTDKEINNLVYQLYKLTDDEIQLIETL